MSNKDDKSSDSMRLDKWLWCARFYKTRGLASDAIKTGKVKINGERIKPARNIKIGEVVAIRRGPYNFEITILSLSKTRLSADKAAQLYQEHEQSITNREMTAQQLNASNAMFPPSKGRPTKRERRDLNKFKQAQD